MKKVRAKFSCNSIEDFGWNKTAKLSAVVDSKGDNADFTKATPNGQLSISISKEVPASDFFEVGKSYFIDFSEAPTA